MPHSVPSLMTWGYMRPLSLLEYSPDSDKPISIIRFTGSVRMIFLKSNSNVKIQS